MLPSPTNAAPAPSPDPLAEYHRRAGQRQARADQLAARYRAFFRLRRQGLFLIVAVLWLCEKERFLLLLVAGPIVLFVVAVLVKNHAWRAWQQTLRAVAFYRRRLANLTDQWAGTGDPGTRYLDDTHPCARDLDLFGRGSLFERLHLAGTPLGEDTLAAWLRTPAGAEEVRARQAAVDELRDRLDLREDLALLGQQVPAGLGSAVPGPLLRVLARRGRERFTSPRLRGPHDTLRAARPRARLVRLLDYLPLGPLALPILRGTRLARAVEAWRRRRDTALAGWLAALGELEALDALAAYAWENPLDPFPQISDEGPCFDGVGLGHPLLPAARRVRNDLCLDASRSLLIVSGSNMSGKSTLLRAVGVSAVLALAGGPVRATRLRLSPLAPGATLRLEDSLLEGRSRFFAEVTRVRQLLDLAREQPPLLFLLDELFSGTNSDDRRQGAEAVVRRLLDAGAIGLLTTHDLALTHLAQALAPRAANVHFADQLTDGTLTFDYRMRPGVLRSGNGLALMRAVGIEV